ncbi:MAG TPA: NepR family anti-sigma factor [Aliidongia sp.]|uniref:NepR family anti-sigma factor n=1 Tax=Aliidongia sp. TaxID=1914230 RepID=UPI002DDD27C8|nr:NepR family anti-sigma factor [Aliidongia sp.]HEV2677677.1 NepR family anti-sigma factor [Aliidongia sp.]
MADGGSPDAHDWSFPMAKRATTGDRERKAPTLSVVGGTPTPQKMSLGLDADVETHIGGRLRAMYDSVLREPVPDRFLDLLRQIDDKMSGHTDPAQHDGGMPAAKNSTDDR